MDFDKLLQFELVPPSLSGHIDTSLLHIAPDDSWIDASFDTLDQHLLGTSPDCAGSKSVAGERHDVPLAEQCDFLLWS